MSFNNNVDYMPNQSFSGGNSSDEEHAQFQKRKWQVLVGTFLLVLIIANTVVWTQPSVYQSQAILHFSYQSKTDQGFVELAQQQITLHQHRLTSTRILNLVSQELEENHGLIVDVQSLLQSLSVEANLTGRVISLKANGNDPLNLKPILDALSTVYLQLIASETQLNNSEELQVSLEQLVLLEKKIIEQQQLLALFANENNITSLERDENRLLSQTKNLASNLDQTVAEQAQAQALLDSLNESINSGQDIIRPADEAQISATKANIKKIDEKLSALSEKYTQAYLERDPVIVSDQNNVKQLQKQLAQQIQTSQLKYVQDTQRDVNTANRKAQQLSDQLIEQNKLAQTFSQKLEQYKILDSELKALQSQAQMLKNKQVAQEVSKPFEAKITLLEPAFEPDFAIGPNYQFNTLLSVIGAAIAGVFALLLFSFIVRQKTPATEPNNIIVIPNHEGHIVSQGVAYQQRGQISAPPPTAVTPNPNTLPPVVDAIRLLNANECQALFCTANNQGKVIIGLLLCGVGIDELSAVRKTDFINDYSALQIGGQFSRVITLQTDLSDVVQTMCVKLEQQTIMANIKNQDDFISLLVNVGHDAQLAFPEQLSMKVLRHTYLTYLAVQGVKLNDIEQVAGYTSPSDLALYRNVNQQGKLVDLQQINTHYPYSVIS